MRSPGQGQQVAPPGEVGACDLVIALGGDGTTLAALHAAGARTTGPCSGIACGSLGALTAVTADRLDDALDRVAHRRLRPSTACPRSWPAPRRRRDDPRSTTSCSSAPPPGRSCSRSRSTASALSGWRATASSPRRRSGPPPTRSPPAARCSRAGQIGLVVTPLSPHGGVRPPLVTGPRQPRHGPGSTPATVARASSSTARCTRSSSRAPGSRSSSDRAVVHRARVAGRGGVADRGPAPAADPDGQPARAGGDARGLRPAGRASRRAPPRARARARAACARSRAGRSAARRPAAPRPASASPGRTPPEGRGRSRRSRA